MVQIRRWYRLLGVLAAIFVAGCNSSSDHANASSGTNGKCVLGTYSNPVKYPIASLNEVRGDRPYLVASGFLVNKKRGIFMTARHYFDGITKMGRTRSTMFFNGKVYPVTIYRGTALLDIGLVRIDCDSFDTTGFPDPLQLAHDTVKVGDRVYAMGIHPHPIWLSEHNDSVGRPDMVVPILKDYYQLIRVGPGAIRFVFDRVPGRIREINALKPIDPKVSVNPALQMLRNKVNRFDCMTADHKHLISFGGLSGGAFVNDKGELVGVVSRGASNSTTDLCFVPVFSAEFQNLWRKAFQ